MAKTDWDQVSALETRAPQTFGALQELVMAMAAYQKNRDRKTIFGRDKEPRAFKQFETALRETLTSMQMENLVTKNADAKEYRQGILEMLELFAQVFPRWRPAYEFADEFFVENAPIADERIRQMVKRRYSLRSMLWIWVKRVTIRRESQEV